MSLRIKVSNIINQAEMCRVVDSAMWNRLVENTNSPAFQYYVYQVVVTHSNNSSRHACAYIWNVGDSLLIIATTYTAFLPERLPEG
jgi:hypothetical protein